ncbi:MAG: cytochrome c [Alphaproteobacteria bacterium]
MKNVTGLALVAALAWSSAAAAESLLARGTYLMNSIVACGNCHTPQTPDGPAPGMELAGQKVFEDPTMTAYAPNITQDRETGIGTWTDAQIITAIREGTRPDGSLIGPPMPFEQYRHMSDRDVQAIVVYLRTVKPVTNTVPKSVYNIPLPPAWGPPVTGVTTPDKADLPAYGTYVAEALGHCNECHTPMVKGRFDFANQKGAGGFQFPGPWGVSVAANITPHEDGIAEYTDAEIEQVVRTGLRPDGSRLMPPMGVHYYKNIAADDMKAIIAYLRALPPVPTPQH